MNHVSMMTSMGEMPILDILSFIKMIEIKDIEGDYASYATQSRPAVARMFDGSAFPTASSEMQIHDVGLKCFYTVGSRAHAASTSKNAFTEIVYDAIYQFILEHIKILVAKSEPDVFTKDATVDIIQTAANSMIIDGYQDLAAIHVILSKYQQFLLFVDPKKFKCFVSKSHRYDTDAIELRGAVVDVGIGKNQLIRYDEPSFYKELESKIRYSR